MIEAALVSGIFLLIIVVTIECVIVGYRALTTQYVASRTARFAMVSTIPAGLARTQAVRSFALTESASFGLRIDPQQVDICPIYRDRMCVSNDAGRPGDFVFVRVTVPGQFLLGRFHFPIRGEALTKNEYF